MDGGNVESDNRMHEGQRRLQKLLRREDGETSAGDGDKALPERVSTHSSSGLDRFTASMEKAAKNLRQFNVRPVPPRGARRFHPAGVQDDEPSIPPYFPSSDQKAGTGCGDGASIELDAEHLDGYQRGKHAGNRKSRSFEEGSRKGPLFIL